MANKQIIPFLKKIRPFVGIILFLTLILVSTTVVFFSVASIFVYPLLWVVFVAWNFFRPKQKIILYCLNAVRLAMWVYFVTVFFFILWTPEWLKVWSLHLEGKTWWNVFREGSYMTGRTGFAFILSLVILFSFWGYYKLSRKKEQKNLFKPEEK